MAREEAAELLIPPMALCTDNAAMAALAVEKWRRQEWAPMDLDAVPAYITTLTTPGGQRRVVTRGE